MHHAFTHSDSVSNRGWRSSLARKFVYTDGSIDQVDLERGGGHRGGGVALECLWTSGVPSELPDWRVRLALLLPEPALDVGGEHALALAEISPIEHHNIGIGQ